jgi:hypothetical protein
MDEYIRLKYTRVKVEINQELVKTQRLLEENNGQIDEVARAEISGKLQILEQLDSLIQLLDTIDKGCL